MPTNEQFVKELARRYNVTYEQGDTDKLDQYGSGANKFRELQNDPNANWAQEGISSPDQYEQFKRDLEAQYQKRGANSNGPSDTETKRAEVQYSTPAQSWNAQPQQSSLFPDWYRGLMERQIAQAEADRAETKARADALYGRLDQRANQGLNVSADDPIISGQVNAFRAEQERARRNDISDLAERAGPLANIRGEQRIAAERVGQGTSAFQAELLARERGRIADEISQALAMQGSLLSGDQQRGLTERLAALDQAIRESGVGLQNQSLGLQRDLGFADLGLRRDLGFGGLDLQRTLGLGGQDLTRRGQDLANDQFLRELALRQWQLGDDSDYRWANL